MSKILFVSTLVLNFSGVIFALVYIWLNVFSRITDLEDRNASIIKITKTSMVLSMIFAFLSCLISNVDAIGFAIQQTTKLYSIMAISWLIVLLICGLAMLYAIVIKASFRKELVQTIKMIFKIALWGSIISMILAWLFA